MAIGDLGDLKNKHFERHFWHRFGIFFPVRMLAGLLIIVSQSEKTAIAMYSREQLFGGKYPLTNRRFIAIVNGKSKPET